MSELPGAGLAEAIEAVERTLATGQEGIAGIGYEMPDGRAVATRIEGTPRKIAHVATAAAWEVFTARHAAEVERLEKRFAVHDNALTLMLQHFEDIDAAISGKDLPYGNCAPAKQIQKLRAALTTAEQRGKASGLLHAAAECHRKKWGYDQHDPTEGRPTPTFDALHALGQQFLAEANAARPAAPTLAGGEAESEPYDYDFVASEGCGEVELDLHAECRVEAAAMDGAAHSVWLHGKWRWLTGQMATEEREAFAAAVVRHSAVLEPADPVSLDDLRWWAAPPAEEPAPAEGEWLVWSYYHRMWWKGPGGNGYTTAVALAGRYTREEADRHASLRDWIDDDMPGDVAVRAPADHLLTSSELPGLLEEAVETATAVAIERKAALPAPTSGKGETP